MAAWCSCDKRAEGRATDSVQLPPGWERGEDVSRLRFTDGMPAGRRHHDARVKCMLVGSSFVGKSALLHRYATGAFNANTPTAIMDYKYAGRTPLLSRGQAQQRR